MNVELLLKVKEAIAANPELYDQNTFCGTACCIAGHAVHIADNETWRLANRDWYFIYREAGKLLQMNNDDYEMLTDPPKYWPAPFNLLYEENDDPARRAAIAGQFIDYFIHKAGA